MEAPMKRCHFIGLDVHGAFCEMAVVNAAGRVVRRGRCATNIPALREVLDEVPQPRRLTVEEGPMADWLWRNLHEQVQELIVCEPRRNRLIAAEGDKDDPVDAEKLAQLYRGGYTKAVHHTASWEQALFKQHMLLYHQRVSRRVAEGHRARCLLRRHGIVIRERDFTEADQRPALVARLPDYAVLREDLELLWQSYDLAVVQEERCRRRLTQLAAPIEVVRRFAELPGIGWVRAATLYVFLDTPWRFARKAKLWKYLGIGLERRRSGNGPEQLRVPKVCNRVLKSTILGGAESPAPAGANPFPHHSPSATHATPSPPP